MTRRQFFQKAGAATAITAISLNLTALSPQKRPGQLLNAYYFRAHMYTCVPRHIREDMQGMADIGTDIVSVGVLEQGLFAAVENIAIICEEAERAGMQVYAVPSRWGGLVAGAPKVPSLFSITNPQTWMKEKDGSYMHSRVSGRISSIYYPETSKEVNW